MIRIYAQCPPAFPAPCHPPSIPMGGRAYQCQSACLLLTLHHPWVGLCWCCLHRGFLTQTSTDLGPWHDPRVWPFFFLWGEGWPAPLQSHLSSHGEDWHGPLPQPRTLFSSSTVVFDFFSDHKCFLSFYVKFNTTYHISIS